MTEQASTETKPKNAFIVRVKKGQNVALEKNVIGIGWGKVEGMDSFAAEKLSWGALKKRISSAYPNLTGRSLGNVAGSIERFCMENQSADPSMSIGDYVLMPTGDSFHIGIVKSKVKKCTEEWVQGTYLQWQREVEWLTKSRGAIPRGAVHNDLEIRLKARQTCIDASDRLKFIDEILAKDDWTTPPFRDLVKSNARDAVKKSLTAINDSKLEALISALCKDAGAKVLPKNDSTLGDADVQADYPVYVGNTKYLVRVLYQAKKHTGTTSSSGVSQLIDRIKTLNEEGNGKDFNIIAYKGCLVTTADEVTNEATEIAAGTPDDELVIDIITLDKLVDWILDAGLSDLNV
jgi:hypothetical protein